MARKARPVADVADEYLRLYGKGAEERFVTEVSDVKAARRLWHEWTAEIESRLEGIRSARKGTGTDLTKVQARALAGEWYKWYTGKHAGSSSYRWEEQQDALQSELQPYAAAYGGDTAAALEFDAQARESHSANAGGFWGNR